MRGIGLFFGSSKRNGLYKLTEQHPRKDYGTKGLTSGDAGKDGYTVLSKADPEAQGNPPRVKGNEGPLYWGPDQSFEQ